QALYDVLPAIRASVTQRLEYEPVDTFPGWRPQTGLPKLMTVSAFGGIYPSGGEPAYLPSTYWPGWQIARAIRLVSSGGGYVLDGFGALHPFGGAPALPVSVYWRGWDAARDFVMLPSGTRGYVLDEFGG